MELFDKIKSILFKPTKFFSNLKEKGVKDAFLFSILLGLFSVILNLLTKYSAFYNLAVLYGLSFPTFVILFFILSLLSQFAFAGLLHVWILIFGGKEKYSKTYQLSIYSLTPSWLVGWIPFAGPLVATIYYLVLLIVGTQQVHKIRRTKAILMYVVPAILFGFLIFVLLIFSIILAVPLALNQ